MMLFSTLILGIASLNVVSAVPFSELARNLPSNVTHIAHDERNLRYIAYTRDGTIFGTYPADDVSKTLVANSYRKRDNGSCSDLSVQDAQKMTVWPKIEAYAKSNWGSGSYNLATNPLDQLDQPAQACLDGGAVHVTLTNTPTCTNNTGTSDGELVGTNGTVTIGFQEGYSSSTTWTVTKESSFGVSTTVKVSVGIPDLADVSTELTTTAEFSNTLSSSFQTTISNTATQSLTVSSPAGKNCHVEYSISTCNSEGQGKVLYVATGWVWFNYNSKTQGHYKWAASIDTILPDKSDRSSEMDFTGSMQGSVSTNYKGICDP